MRNKFFLFISLLLIIFSCKTITKKEEKYSKNNIENFIKEKNETVEKREEYKEYIDKEKYLETKINEKLKSMSLIEKRGLLSMVSIPDYELKKETIDFLNNNKIKGVILFKYNIKNEDQLKKLIKDLKEKVDPYLLIAVDQEGGNIVRIDWEETAKISPQIIYYSENSYEFAYNIAYKRGSYLKSLGINVILGPVADVPSKNSDFIFKRSFGTDPERVANLIEATVKGYKDAGIICVLKHFPGHGKTKIDSHYEFPVINKEIEDLIKDDLLPFITGIKSGVDMIMIGHIINSFIDKENPASLSYNYVNLLNHLNFKGVIITDDLAMTGKIKKGIGWGINIITGKSFNDIQKIIDTIEPIDYYVKRVIRLVYFKDEV